MTAITNPAYLARPLFQRSIPWFTCLIYVTSMLFAALCLPLMNARAEATDWLNAPTLQLSQGAPPPVGLTPGNFDCYPTPLPVKTVNEVGGIVTEGRRDETVCAQTTALGLVGVGKPYAQFGSASFAQHIYNPDYPKARFYSVPNTKDFLVSTPSTRAGYYFFMYPNPLAYGTTVNDTSNFHESLFKLPIPSDQLRSSNNQPLSLQNFAFSANGEYLVAQSVANQHVLIRLHLRTRTIQPFAAGEGTYGVGSDPNYNFAVSNDGRYVVKAGFNNGAPTIYDLQTCMITTDISIIPSQLGCKSRSLDSLMSTIGGFRNLHTLRFDPASTSLQAIVDYTESGQFKQKQLTIATPDFAAVTNEYLALGDSFASGEGDMQGTQYYEDGTNTISNHCRVSRRSYSYLIARSRGIIDTANASPHPDSPFHSTACSGARMENITKYKQYKAPDIAYPLGSWLPGVQAQIAYLKAAKPKYATLSIGGNDAGFGVHLKSCAISINTCNEALPSQRWQTGAELRGAFDYLARTYQQVHAAAPETKLFVVGYPIFVKPGGDCALNVHLNNEELLYVHNATHYMNTVIKAAAAKAGLYYLDVEQAFNGVALCAGPSSTLAFNGLSAGDDTLGLIGSESFHPNFRGHQLLAAAITAAIGSDPARFDTCPATTNTFDIVCPDASITAPAFDTSYFGTIPAINSDTPLIRDMSATVERIQDNLATSVSLDSLRPGSIARFELHSTPVDLGSFTVQIDGTLNVQLSLPVTTPVGYHMLHAFITNTAGESQEFYQEVFVPGPPNDLDADTIPNETDPCPMVAASTIDADHDGRDDACDPEIAPGVAAQPLPEPSPAPTPQPTPSPAPPPTPVPQPTPSGQLYRVRNGDPKRTYVVAEKGKTKRVNANEKKRYVYFERNVRLAKNLFAFSDYDPDSDGWSIVGSSDDRATRGKLADFWTETSQAPITSYERVVPYAAVKAHWWNCARLKPDKLTVVIKDEHRGLQIEATKFGPCFRVQK